MALDDADVLATYNGQITPGCPTASAVLDGYNQSQPFWAHISANLPRLTFSPPIIPTRTRYTWKDLSPGSFILFQLDKQELPREPHVPEGSESLERYQKFLPKRYAGLVVGSFRGDSDSDAEEYVIAFVSKTLPPASGSSSDPDLFAVPIAPTRSENTNNRQPLKPKPFPWGAGCYQYTTLGMRIIPTHIYTSTIEYKLEKKDFRAFEDFFIYDHATCRQWRDMPPVFDEARLFENMKLSDAQSSLPVKVWYVLTAEEECPDPREFVKEAFYFRKQLARAGAKGSSS